MSQGHEKAFSIILACAASGGLTLAEIARQVGLPKSTTHVIATELLQKGYLVLDPVTRHVSPGPAALDFSARILSLHTGIGIIRPFLERLAAQTQQDTYYAVLVKDYAVYIDKIEGLMSVRVKIALGAPRLLHATAAGKVLLAFGGPELLNQVLRKGLERLTPLTITDPEQLCAELAEVRQLGYAVSREESIEGVCAFAAPVRARAAQVVGAVSLSCVKALALDPGHRRAWVECMLATAADISALLASPAGLG